MYKQSIDLSLSHVFKLWFHVVSSCCLNNWKLSPTRTSSNWELEFKVIYVKMIISLLSFLVQLSFSSHVLTFSFTLFINHNDSAITTVENEFSFNFSCPHFSCFSSLKYLMCLVNSSQEFYPKKRFFLSMNISATNPCEALILMENERERERERERV